MKYLLIITMALTQACKEVPGLTDNTKKDEGSPRTERIEEPVDDELGGIGDTGGTEGDDGETVIALDCEANEDCPSHRFEPWRLWTTGKLRTAETDLDFMNQATYFAQLEITWDRGETYELHRITSVYVDSLGMGAYLTVAGVGDKYMPLRQGVMQGQSVWELGRFSVQSNAVNSWWLTMRNSRWVTPVKAAVDMCLHAYQTAPYCHTLYLEVSEDFVP